MAEAVHRLSQNGGDWVRAEVSLARAEVSADSRRVLLALILAGCVLVSVLVAAGLLSFAAVAYLAYYTGGLANAAALIGALLLVIAAVCALTIRKLAASTTGVKSLVRRWRSFAVSGLGRAR